MAEYGDMAIAAMGVAMKVVTILFTNQIVSAFLADTSAFGYAVQFSRILLTTSFLFGVFYVLTNALQAMGAATAALVINVSRQGIIFIPASKHCIQTKKSILWKILILYIAARQTVMT